MQRNKATRKIKAGFIRVAEKTAMTTDKTPNKKHANFLIKNSAKCLKDILVQDSNKQAMLINKSNNNNEYVTNSI